MPPRFLGPIMTLLAVNLNIFNHEQTDLHRAGEPTPLDLRVLDDMGLLRKVGGTFFLTPAGPVVPCNERVF